MRSKAKRAAEWKKTSFQELSITRNPALLFRRLLKEARAVDPNGHHNSKAKLLRIARRHFHSFCCELQLLLAVFSPH
jgi:hypothetical protein